MPVSWKTGLPLTIKHGQLTDRITERQKDRPTTAFPGSDTGSDASSERAEPDNNDVLC